MSELQFYDGVKVRLRNGEYDEIVLRHKPWQLRRAGIGITNDGLVLLGRDDPYDVVGILPPEATTPTVELGKWYPCRDGINEAKIYAKDLPGDYPLLGIHRKIGEAEWSETTWTAQGWWRADNGEESDLDLMLTPPAPKRHTYEKWANCYPDKAVWVSETREQADEHANRDRIACVRIKIDFAEGEGLEPKQP